jgi:prefoldin subunit 5
MYNNPYYQNIYNPQSNIDRINEQITQLEKMKQQMQQPVQQPQPTNLTQNFQLAPTNHTMRFVNTIDDVNKEVVYYDTPYFSKDMSVLWVKNAKGDIKSYELNEIIPKDEKDLQIEFLQSQIEELRKEMKNNEQYIPNDDETSTSKNDGAIGKSTKKSQSTSIQDVSGSKTK